MHVKNQYDNFKDFLDQRRIKQQSLSDFAIMEEYYDAFVDKGKDVLALITKKNFEAYRKKFEKEVKTADYELDYIELMCEEVLHTGRMQIQNIVRFEIDAKTTREGFIKASGNEITSQAADTTVASEQYAYINMLLS
ncbi:hypothetical protein KCU77_g5039, partial [Aureobasidium melanogenum]